MQRWPDGWYVYEDGQVHGPLAATEAFKLSPETESGKPRLISRKGFTQWYALQDLSEIFRLTEAMGARADTELVRTAQQIAATAAPASSPQVVGKTIAPQAMAVQRALAEQGVPLTATPPTFAELAPTKATPASVAATPAPTPAPAAVHVTEKALLQQYFHVQKRLRLGKLRNAWLTAFFGFAATLGLYWLLWFKELTTEAAHHAQLGSNEKVPHVLLAALPGLHCYATFRLAQLVATMERQNRYTHVRPGVAAALSVVPPFAMLYLQRAANRHWLLHVQHTLQVEQARRNGQAHGQR